MSQYNLTIEDYEAVSACLCDLYRLRDVTGLGPVMLEITSRLIPCIFCTFNEMNLQTGKVVAAYHPESMREPFEALMPELSAHVEDHPVYQKVYATGEGHPQMLADYVTESEWQERPFGKLSAQVQARDHLLFSLQNLGHLWIFIAISRPQWNFSERDRAIATLLRPHFSAAYENAIAFTEAQAGALMLDQMIDLSPHGIVVLDGRGRVAHMNAHAFTLLERYFQKRLTWQATMPARLIDWLKEQNASPKVPVTALIVEAEGKSLIVRASPVEKDRRIILLRETKMKDNPGRLRSLGLTQREAEVLYWLSEGKSNSELGGILHISPRTVGKHLETIYRKLAVENRMGAMIKATHHLAASE